MGKVRSIGLLKLSLVVVLSLPLAACASGAQTEAMFTGVVPSASPAKTTSAKEAVTIGTVEGGSETYALWKSNVSTENFREALKQSLQANHYLASMDGPYKLDANLLDLDQPLIGGFDMTVTAKVQYKVTEVKTAKKVFDETIVTPYTADFSDALLAVERLRLANEGAVRENILALIKKIQTVPELNK